MTSSSRQPQVREGALKGMGVPEALLQVDAFVRAHLSVLAELSCDQVAEWSEDAYRKRLLIQRDNELYQGKDPDELTEDELDYGRAMALSLEAIDRRCAPGQRLGYAIDSYKSWLCDPGPRGSRSEELASMTPNVAAFVLLLTWLAHDQETHLAPSIGLDIQLSPWGRFGEFFEAHEEVVVADRGSFQDRLANDPSLSPGHWRESACASVQSEPWLRVVEVAMLVVLRFCEANSSSASGDQVSASGVKPLSGKPKQAYGLIKASPGIRGKQLAAKLDVSEGHLRSYVLPQLKNHGLTNPGRGYHIEVTAAESDGSESG